MRWLRSALSESSCWGGWLVLRGETNVGTIVAALTGMSRIDRPWKNLVKFYRSLGTVLVRYGLLADVIA